MDKEKVLARIKELEDQKLQLMNQYIAVDGALQDSKFWLTKLEEKPNDENNSE